MDTANAQTEPAQQTEQTQQTEELAETEPAQEEETAQEETEADDETAAAIPSLDAVPVDRPPGEPDTAEDLVGDWHGLVAELGHYGAAYEGTQPTEHDLIAILDQEESTGKYFFEAYLPDGDSSVLSAYITMADDHFTGDIGEDDAWILNDYLTPDQNGLLYARYDDPTTLYVQYDYEDPEEDNAGFHLSFYFRRAGESWNDLPYTPGYVK